MEIVAVIVLVCLGATGAILMGMARASRRRRRRAWQSYYDGHRRHDGAPGRRKR